MNFNWLKEGVGGIFISVRIIPNAAVTQLEGVVVDDKGQHQIKIRVNAVPEKGKANKVLLKYIAKQIHVSPSCMTIIKGDTTRNKRIRIEGEASHIISNIENWLKTV